MIRNLFLTNCKNIKELNSLIIFGKLCLSNCKNIINIGNSNTIHSIMLFNIKNIYGFHLMKHTKNISKDDFARKLNNIIDKLNKYKKTKYKKTKHIDKCIFMAYDFL